jgi:hypothetical protein
MYYLLFIVDLAWSGAAWVVDYDKLFIIPVWAWPFCLVCPIYPLLLAIVWYKKAKNIRVNDWLMAIAVIASSTLGPLAIVYYPLKMINNGFDILDFGQIFWVLFYSIQGWILLRERISNKVAVISAVLFLVVKFTIDLKYLSFDYLDFSSLQHNQLVGLYILAVSLSLSLGICNLRKS